MNSRILNEVVLQRLRYSQCRYLSVQHNINKCSSTCHTVNFHRRNENRSTNFIFTQFSNNRTLCQSTLPIYTCFQRNLSVTSKLYQTKDSDPLKILTDVAPSPTVEATQCADINYDSAIKDNILVDYTLQFFIQVHEHSGLPWWASIVLSTFMIRTFIVLPFAATQVCMLAKLEKVNLNLVDIDKQLKKESVKAQKQYGWPEFFANEKYKQAKDNAWWKLMQKENCHPAKIYLLIPVHLTTWFTMTAVTSALCNPEFVSHNIVDQIRTGGFGWVTDLTQTDPYFILPLSIGLVNLLLVEIHNSFKVLRRSKQEQWTSATFRILSIALIPLAASAPAAINVCWLSSSIYGLVQAFILNSSPARRLLRVPMNHPGLNQPYRYFLKNTKEKLRLGKGETELAVK